jgi:hypothetical protein
MQRSMSKPSVTWLLLVALLVTSGVLTAVRGLGDAQNVTHTCSGYGYGYLAQTGYANPAPQLTLNLSADVTVSQYPVVVSGTLTQNGCALAGQSVQIKRRAVVATVPSGSFVTLTTVTTDAHGFYSYTTTQTYNSQFQATVVGTQGRPTVNSPTRVLRLFSRVGARAPVSSHLYKARICGVTAPIHVGTPIVLYRGIRGEWVKQQAKRVLSDRSYCFALYLPQGKTPIKIRMYTTDTNLFGQRSFYATRT